MFCHKFGYDSRSEAEKVVNIMRRKKNNKQKPKRTYKCPVCNKWHITSEN